MMKMNRKYGIVALVLIGVLCAGIVYAAFTVTSNIAGVTVNYVIALNTAGYPSLSATLTNNGAGVYGATVYFWYTYVGIGQPAPLSTDPGWVQFDSKTTDGSGFAGGVTFSPPVNGYDYYFKVTYAVP